MFLLVMTAGLASRWVPGRLGAASTAAPPTAAAAVPPANDAGRQLPQTSGSLEFSGFRINRDAAGTANVHFVVLNHSASEVHGAAVQVVLRLATAKPFEPPLATFSMKLPTFGDQESKETSARVDIPTDGPIPDQTGLRADVKVTYQQ